MDGKASGLCTKNFHVFSLVNEFLGTTWLGLLLEKELNLIQEKNDSTAASLQGVEVNAGQQMPCELSLVQRGGEY
ncbi:hypothetical protein E2320_013004, partial [Naja naja]